MGHKPVKITTVYVESLIFVIRGQRVMVDSDLANIYGVSTKALNQAVKRNANRFPEDFVFQLISTEKEKVVTNCDHLKNLRFSHVLPYAFTEYGAIMAANVLNSASAVEMSVFVVRAFVRMREKLTANNVWEKRLAEIEKKLLLHDSSLRDLYDRIRPLLLPSPEKPKRRIGFTAEESKANYHGKLKGEVVSAETTKKFDSKKHPFFGSRKNDKRSVKQIMKGLRRPRYHDL